MFALGESSDEIDDERVHQALAMAELDDFVRTQTQGIGTMVGERGVKLSGGQRQRIGIARASISAPKSSFSTRQPRRLIMRQSGVSPTRY